MAIQFVPRPVQRRECEAQTVTLGELVSRLRSLPQGLAVSVSITIDGTTVSPVLGSDIESAAVRRAASASRTRRYRANRRALGMAPQFDAAAARARLLERDGAGCAYCDSADQSVDHIVPIAAGGTDDFNNLALACLDCNRRKAGRTPAQAGMAIRKASVVMAHSGYEPPPPGTVTPWTAPSRPPAMSNAEKQRRYRERKKAKG